MGPLVVSSLKDIAGGDVLDVRMRVPLLGTLSFIHNGIYSPLAGRGVTVTFTIRVRKTPGSNPGAPTGLFSIVIKCYNHHYAK